DVLPSSGATYYDTDCPSVIAPVIGSTGGTVTCLVGTMAPNAIASFDVELLVNASNAAGTIISNSATASDDALDKLSGGTLKITDAVDVVVASAPSAAALALNVSAGWSSMKL